MTVALSRVWEYQADGADLSGEGLLFIGLAGCSLDEKPGSNWVQESGGLPEYICQVAKGIKKSGHDTSSAIRLAVGTIKNWASGQKHVDPDTRAKAAKAVAEWEALKAKAHAKSAAKSGAKVAASNTDETYEFISLCAETFNTDVVQQAFRAQLADHMFPKEKSKYSDREYPRDYSYVQQMWSNFIIATGDLDGDGDTDYYKIPFHVDPEDGSKVTFDAPIEVRQEWLTVDGDKADGSDELSGKDLTDEHLSDLLKMSRSGRTDDVLGKFVALANEGT